MSFEPKCKICGLDQMVQDAILLYRQSGLYSLKKLADAFNRAFDLNLNSQNIFDHLKKHVDETEFEPKRLNEIRTFLAALYELETGKRLEVDAEWRGEIDALKVKIQSKNKPKKV